MTLILSIILLNSIAFLAYGVSCLFSQKMISEFIRFGLASYQRYITGIAQILGSLGLIVGYFIDLRISVLSAIGLFTLMLAGFIVRIKVKDSFAKTFPSFLFMLINLFLACLLVEKL